jgi:acyl-CoA reductase-like NAD-dependent aldehyde dehydrogenase
VRAEQRERVTAVHKRLLRRFAAVDAHRDELAELEVRNAGHVIGNARWEAGNVPDVLCYAAAPERQSGRQIALLQALFAKDPERAGRRLVHIPKGRFAESRDLRGLRHPA